MSGRFLFGVLLTVFAMMVPVAPGAAEPPFVFEDRNNNGIFDGSDVEITQLLYDQLAFETKESVVFTGGPFKARDTHSKTTFQSGGVWITAGKNITITSNLLASFYDGIVQLDAGDSVVVGSGVLISAKNRIHVEAAKRIELGDRVTIISTAGSLNEGAVHLRSSGSFHAGSKLTVRTRTVGEISAAGGDLSLGPGSRVTSPQGEVSVIARTDLTAPSARLTARDGVDVFSLGGKGPIDLRNGKLSCSLSPANGGSIIVYAPKGTVDVTGAVFNFAPQIEAQDLIQ